MNIRLLTGFGIVMVFVGLLVVTPLALSTLVLGVGDDVAGTPRAVVDINEKPGGLDGVVTVSLTTLENADGVDVRATVVDGSDSLEDQTGEQSDELVKTLTATGKSATFQRAADRKVDVRIVAVVVQGDEESLVADKQITL